ncbi:MAG: TonB-dependent receptor [Phenylobacterium sp.]|uniref:TonB-dependent receptor n=1 Tax=Phenylobacterium sp. TaxID=1871053 RepID=UPI0027185886|nr:TonB-dependent receptor [Phenylobacterium sp.]MDO8914152.1 TonB-dependent receptor [Phenylobacterium sp.]MDP3101475.1 TonB-dependent receptor [Phenylobacterium sp.]
MVRTRSWTKTRALFSGASLAALTMAVAAPAFAQQNEVEEVIVTGFRGSLQQALELKRGSATAGDTILAEDIGKFPDLNLSESIQRISGVALARDGGEGRQISVRGLGPQFTRVRINGMEALTTAGGTDASGGTNRGRSFDFNIFAADLFNSITVQKTSAAETEEGSLGATVDLRTARPLDYDGFKFVASAQASYNSLSEDSSPRAAGMISNTWADGTFGALLSLAYSKRSLLDVGASTVRWAAGDRFAPGFDALPNGAGLPTTVNPAAAANNAAYHPRFPRYDRYDQEQERLGATFALQWKPTDATELTFDYLYAKLDGSRQEQFLEAPSFSVGGACTAANVATSCGIADTNVVSSTITNGVMTAGTFDDVDLRVEDRYDELTTTFNQYSLDFSHAFSDTLKIHAVAGHSESDHQNPVQTTIIWDQFNVDGYRFDYGQGRAPLLTYGNADLTNPSAWRLTQVRMRPQSAVNTYDTVAFDGEWKPNDILTFKAGLSWKQYEFESTELRRSNSASTNQETVIPAGVAAIATSTYAKTVTLPTEGLGVPGGSTTSWISPNYFSALTLFQLNDPTAFGGAWRMGKEPSLSNNNSVGEKDKGGFVQADWDTELAGMPFRGNIGVRYVKTEQTASGYTFLAGAPVPITVDRKYDDTLPSLNMVIEPVENFLVRFGAAQTMSRPNLGSLTPGASVSVSGSSRTVTAGNPNLDPFRAKAYDLSFEWYYQPEALLSVAFFKKEIDSFVQTLSTQTTFTGNPFGLPDSVATAACGATVGCSPSATWNFSTPINTPGGDLTGFEVSFQQPFSFLPGPLANTGIIANYTSVKSSIDYYATVGGVTTKVATNDLTGLSRKAYNLTLYYEDDKISARVSASHRDKYLTRVPGQEAGMVYDGTNETMNLDASFTYTLNDHLKFTLEGVNLTDEFQDQFNGTQDLMNFYHHTGREYLIGVRYTY